METLTKKDFIEAVRAKNLVVSPRKVPDSIQMPSRYP